MLGAVFCLAVLNLLVKLLADRYAIAEIVFFRSLFALGPATLMVAAAGGWRTTTIVFFFTLNATVAAAALPLAWITPTLPDFGLMALTGLCGGASQFLTTRAFTLGPAAVIGPFNYASILWATLFGYLMWGDLPDLWVIVGAVLVICGGLAIACRETRRPPPAAPDVIPK